MTSDEFSDQLGDLVGSALLNKLPAFRIASELLRATCAVTAATEVDIDDLLADLNSFVTEMNNDHRAHLH